MISNQISDYSDNDDDDMIYSSQRDTTTRPMHHHNYLRQKSDSVKERGYGEDTNALLGFLSEGSSLNNDDDDDNDDDVSRILVECAQKRTF